MKTTTLAAALVLMAGAASADNHMTPMVEAKDQDVSNGVVSADKVMASQNGWLVVHRTDAEMKPGPVVGYAPIRAGEAPRQHELHGHRLRKLAAIRKRAATVNAGAACRPCVSA